MFTTLSKSVPCMQDMVASILHVQAIGTSERRIYKIGVIWNTRETLVKQELLPLYRVVNQPAHFTFSRRFSKKIFKCFSVPIIDADNK